LQEAMEDAVGVRETQQKLVAAFKKELANLNA
jgi:hypothetical protein